MCAETPATNGIPDMQVAVLSEKGNREENQDWMSWSRVAWGECYIVADGMGGYKGGAVASKMTVEGLERYLKELPADWSFEKALREALQRTNREVYTSAHSGDPSMENMGSTVAVALISDSKVQVGHLGDSRVYLLRNGQLRLLTKDHTAVQRMVDAGMITPEQAREHPDAHILSRAVGSKPEAEIEIGEPVDLQQGDGVLLCSDGVHAYVDDAQLEKVVNRSPNVQEVPNAVIDLALRSGSDDNLTVQFIRYGTPTGMARRLTARLLGRAGSKDTLVVPKTDRVRLRGKQFWAAVLGVFAIVSVIVWIGGMQTPDTGQGSGAKGQGRTHASVQSSTSSNISGARITQTGTSRASDSLERHARPTTDTHAANTKLDPSKTTSPKPPTHSSRTEHGPEVQATADQIDKETIPNIAHKATAMSTGGSERVRAEKAAGVIKIPVLVLVQTEGNRELARKVIEFIQKATPEFSPAAWDQADEEQPDLPSNAMVIYTEDSDKSVAGRLASALQNMPDGDGIEKAQILRQNDEKLADSAKAKAGQSQYLIVVLPR